VGVSLIVGQSIAVFRHGVIGVHVRKNVVAAITQERGKYFSPLYMVAKIVQPWNSPMLTLVTIINVLHNASMAHSLIGLSGRLVRQLATQATRADRDRSTVFQTIAGILPSVTRLR
jgi:hypothetical protein